MTVVNDASSTMVLKAFEESYATSSITEVRTEPTRMPFIGTPRLDSLANICGNMPSLAAAIGISATSMVQPFRAPIPEMMAQAAITTPPAVPPNMLLSASANGAVESTSSAYGTVPITATVLSM